jgi:hypothetical protein
MTGAAGAKGHNPQRWHRDVVGEMHKPVGQRARYIAEPSGQPAGDDNRNTETTRPALLFDHLVGAREQRGR